MAKRIVKNRNLRDAVLGFYEHYEHEHTGRLPSLSECSKYLGYASSSNVQPIVAQLVAEGYMEGLFNTSGTFLLARTVRITDKGRAALGVEEVK